MELPNEPKLKEGILICVLETWHHFDKEAHGQNAKTSEVTRQNVHQELAKPWGQKCLKLYAQVKNDEEYIRQVAAHFGFNLTE